MKLKGFIFDHSWEESLHEEFFSGIIPFGIVTTEGLLTEISKKLNFPFYFGGNWNALYDCLCDLNWIDGRNVMLIHEDLPQIPKDDLVIYLEILRDVCADWKNDDEHQLFVIFPMKYERTINTLVAPDSD